MGRSANKSLFRFNPEGIDGLATFIRYREIANDLADDLQAEPAASTAPGTAGGVSIAKVLISAGNL